MPETTQLFHLQAKFLIRARATTLQQQPWAHTLDQSHRLFVIEKRT
jgi:hypothetical protein